MRRKPLCIAKIPSAAQRLIKIHDRKKLITLGLRERVFCGEEQLLRFQHFEVARPARGVPKQRQLNRFSQSGDLVFQCGPLRRRGFAAR